MHYTGTIWRPPYEAASLLLQVTAGCTHHKCKFCTLYNDLPFRFRMSPMEHIEGDLREVKREVTGWDSGSIDRVFLTGANPFVLSYDKLAVIAEQIHKYLPSVKSIGSFARITDITLKTGCNRIHPVRIGANMLTVYPDSELYAEIRRGNWREEGELEKYKEVRALLENLHIPTVFAAMGASNAYQFQGQLPKDKKKLLSFLDEIIGNASEEELQRYRNNLKPFV